MNIQVLHIDGCPTWAEASRRLRGALDASGHHTTRIRHRQLTSVEDAARVPFAGSPTILLDGQDLFPAAERTSALACRLYSTPTGPAGLPSTDQIIDAIAAHDHQ